MVLARSGIATRRLMRVVDIAVATLAIVAVLAAAAFTADAASPDAGVTRVLLLRNAAGASIVIDLHDPVDRARVVSSTDVHSLSVEFGPVRQEVVAQTFVAALSSPLVREVGVRAIPQPNNAVLVRVEVKALVPVSGRVRGVGRRVYVDVVPIESSTATANRNMVAHGSQPPAPAVNPADDGRWESDVLQRAAGLAKRPDVMGLLRLRAAWLERAGWTEGEAPPGREDDGRTLTQLERYLDQARQSQLSLDSQLLQQTEQVYRGAVKLIFPDLHRLERIAAGWNAGSAPPADLPPIAAALLARLRALQPATALAEVHANLCSALDSVAAATGRSHAESAKRASASELVRAIDQYRDAWLR